MSNRFLTTALVFVFCCSAWATKRYCTPAGSLSNNGASWADATSDIQKIINASSSGDTVWVAAGTYYPNRRADATSTITNNDRSNSFVLKSGVKVMGGFAGTEIYFSQRNINANITILSGDLGTPGNNSDNAYMVVIAAGNLGTAELNGFTITGGNATFYNGITVNSVSIEQSKGGGIACYSSSPILSNLIVSGCTAYYGGGICIFGSSPSIYGLSISGCTSRTGAGMLITSSSSPVIQNLNIHGNTSSDSWGTGGGILSESSSTPVIKNALIYKNTSYGFGAGVYLNGGTLTLVNSTVVYNTVTGTSTNGDGAGLKVASGTFNLQNSIVWGNTVDNITKNVAGTINYNYCILEAGTVSGTTIISNTNPRFVSTSADNYQIPSWSPAVNAGNNSYNSTTTDLAGNTRIYDGTIDLGAYECQSAPTVLTKTRTIYVKKTASGTNDGSSWTNAFTELSDALLESDNSGTVAQIWVAAGTYVPTKYAGNGTASGDKSFVLQKDVAIYGGFSGSETALSQRNWVSNPTILSGNSTMYHVIISAGNVGTAVLDGFSIISGNAGSWGNNIVNEQTIEWSFGGGIFCSASSPTLSNLKIYSNTSTSNGAAIYCKASSYPTIENSLIYKNRASQSSGGVYSNASNPLLINCTIVNNEGQYSGAGINGICTVKNSIVWGNTVSGSANNTNGSITFTYSLVQNETVSGTSIISNADPLFVDNSADNYRLQVSSPAKNVGNNSYLTALSVTTDLDGMDRFSSTVDLGAYEYRGIIYVKKGSTGTNGLSWGDALGELSDAITKANTTNASVAGTITDIWVTAGTYYPQTIVDGSDPRDKVFYMPANVKVYGGFVGTESNVTQRDYLTNETILSGDLGADSSTGNNAYHVVAYSGSVGTAELNGFTIKDGYADDGLTKTFNGNSINRNTGSGVVCHTSSPSLQNLKISNCYTNDNGAGIFCYGSSPTINNCKIYSNQAQKEGGGIYITNSSAPLISNCTIYNNSILDDWKNGGGFKCANGCNAQIINCLFYGNVARASGGAISNDGGTLTVVNSTIVYNNSTGTNGVGYGGGVFGDNTINIKNCIVWGNTVNGSVNNANGLGLSFTTSLVESKTASGIISNSNPMFSNESSHDYTLTKFSPAINTGTNSANTLTTDLAGNSRIYNSGTIDLGAYEYQTAVPTYAVGANGVLYVKKGATGGGSSWNDAVGELSDALLISSMIQGVTQIWAAEGTYYPNATNGSSSRESSFTMLNNLKLYGGFAGTETLTAQRNIASHPTILSGDIGTVGNNNDNVYHVVVAAGSLGTACLDGFTVTGGNANGSSNTTINSVSIAQNVGGGIASYTSNVPLKNLTVTGNSAAYGGGIYGIDINSATFDSLTVISNTATTAGGGIYFRNGTFTLQNSSLLANVAQNDGGGLYIYDWANYAFKNLSVKNNVATSGKGGGIYIASVNSQAYYNLLFAQNQAGTYGGGMYIESSPSSAPTLNNSTFAHNRASTDGAGLYLQGSLSATLNNAIVWGNRKTNGTINNNIGTISYNYSLVQGAALNSTSIVKNINPIFLDSVGGDFRLKYNSPAINQGNNNYASSQTYDLAGKTRVLNTTIDLGAYECYIPNTIYVKPTAKGGGESWADAMGEVADAMQAAISANAASAGTVSQIWVKAGTYYPLYKAGNGSSSRDQAFVLPANVKIYGGFAGTETLLSQRDWTANSSILSGDIGTVGSNTDNAYHVVISAGNVGTAELNGFTITGGNADGGSFVTLNGINLNHGFGGGIYSINSSPIIGNSLITTNNASNGGGIYNYNSSPVLTGDSIYDNTASISGGGVYNISSSAPIMTNVNIYSNSATTYYGGGIYNNSSSPTITNARIHNNSAVNSSNGNGGGIFNLSSSPTISNSFIYSNAAANGAGIYNSSSSPILTGDSIFSNTATYYGGGIRNEASSIAILTNVSIRNNTANNGGGGIYNLSSSPVITQSKIYDNRAAQGGGVYNFGSATTAAPVFTNVWVQLNTATDKGGAFYNVGTNDTHRSELALKDVLIAGNSSTHDGGGIYNDKYTSNTYTNVTLAANTTGASYNGGGLYNYTPANCLDVFKNSIIWGNKKGASTASNISNGTVTYYYTLLEGGTVSGSAIISNSDPKFVNTAIGNYRLQGASTGINAGENSYISGVSTDLGGDNRLKYGVVDLGAFEYSQSNKWVGSVSTDPTNANNWSQAATLANNELLEFDGSAQRDLLLTADKTISSLYNHSSRVVNTNGHKLTLTGNVDQSSTITAAVVGSTVEFAGTSAQSISAGMFTNDSVYHLIINNSSNVVASGNLRLANSITATSGKLDVFTNSASLYYSGQLLDNVFLNNKAYNLTLYNASGYAPANDLVVSNNLVLGRNVVFTINPGVMLNVGGSITNNKGVSGMIVKASTGLLPNGSLIFHNASNNPLSATVEMYSKAFKDPNGPTGFKYKWQFFGIPIKSVTADPTFYGSYVSEYNATSATSSWTALTNNSVLTSFKGYEITQLAAKTITFQGTLENANMNINLPYNSGALYPGQHIVANPYTAAINIANITFTNCDGSVYQYNTGSKSDWAGYQGVTTASNPGQYIASTVNTAGQGGIPATIPSMQGFLVKANAGGGTISYSYNSLSAKNSDVQRSKSINTAEKVYAAISVTSSQYADKMWLFTDATCTNGFDTGWDAKKIKGMAVAPQLYAVEKDGEYQIDCKSTIANTSICFTAGVDSVYSLKITGVNLSQAYSSLYLIDSVANKVVSLQMDSTVYQFKATPNSSSFRFRIVENAGLTTDSKSIETESMKGSFYVNAGKLYVAEKCAAEYINIYTATGNLIRNLKKNQLMTSVIDLKLQSGIYLLKSSTGEAKVSVVE